MMSNTRRIDVVGGKLLYSYARDVYIVYRWHPCSSFCCVASRTYIIKTILTRRYDCWKKKKKCIYTHTHARAIRCVCLGVPTNFIRKSRLLVLLLLLLLYDTLRSRVRVRACRCRVCLFMGNRRVRSRLITNIVVKTS